MSNGIQVSVPVSSIGQYNPRAPQHFINQTRNEYTDKRSNSSDFCQQQQTFGQRAKILSQNYDSETNEFDKNFGQYYVEDLNRNSSLGRPRSRTYVRPNYYNSNKKLLGAASDSALLTSSRHRLTLQQSPWQRQESGGRSRSSLGRQGGRLFSANDESLMMRAPALYHQDSGQVALGQQQAPLSGMNNSALSQTPPGLLAGGQRMALKLSSQQPKSTQQQQQQQQQQAHQLWPQPPGNRYSVLHPSVQAPHESPVGECLECQKQESDCSCSNSLDCLSQQHSSPPYQMGHTIGDRQPFLRPADEECAFINNHHHTFQHHQQHRPATLRHTSNTTNLQQQHRPLMPNSSVPPYSAPPTMGASIPLAAAHHHTHPAHASQLTSAMQPLVRQTTYTSTSETITDQSILGQTLKGKIHSSQRGIPLEPLAAAAQPPLAQVGSMTNHPNAQNKQGRPVCQGQTEFIPANERVNEQTSANYHTTAAGVGQAITLEQQQQQHNSNKQRQTVSFRRSITTDQSEPNKQLSGKQQQNIYSEGGVSGAMSAGDKTIDARHNKGGQPHRQRSAGASGVPVNNSITPVPKNLDSSRNSQINNNPASGTAVGSGVGGGEKNTRGNLLNNNNIHVLGTASNASEQVRGPCSQQALHTCPTGSPVVGGAQHMHPHQSAMSPHSATYQHSSPLHGAHRANHLLSSNGPAVAAAATFDGITLPPITSHRTNSPWMRISSIILTPIGIVIILFIVVSPLLHYLM